MSKIIISGDLTYFRPDMLVKIVEALRLDGILTLESQEKGLLSLMQGKVVGATTATHQGLGALTRIIRWNAGTFAFRLLGGASTVEFKRHEDLMAFPDNASLFKYLYAQARPQTLAGVPVAKIMPDKAQTTEGAPVAVPSAPLAPPEPAAATRTVPPAAAGPLARIPDLTDKGRVTLRTLQTNYAMRGVQVEDDIWRALGKVDGRTSVYQIGEACNLRGERLTAALDELVAKGLVKFAEYGTPMPSAGSNGSKMKFGEYMVAKGLINEVQLETALNRQQELARRGRYLWLGELLVELNYTRPSQVQEVLAILKRQ